MRRYLHNFNNNNIQAIKRGNFPGWESGPSYLFEKTFKHFWVGWGDAISN